MNSVITLNVGGTLYTTTQSTLLKYPDSMLGALVSKDFASTLDGNGHLFIDRDGEAFKYVLNFLRSSQLCLPSNFTDIDLLAAEADFYQVTPLIDAVKQIQDSGKRKEKAHLYFIEVVEVRTGSVATMPSCNSRVKVMMHGRKDILKTLPPAVTGADVLERLGGADNMDYTEFELFGPAVRHKVGEQLANLGWSLVCSDMSSSSGIESRAQGCSQVYLEHTFRDRWSHSFDIEEVMDLKKAHEEEKIDFNRGPLANFTNSSYAPQAIHLHVNNI